MTIKSIIRTLQMTACAVLMLLWSSAPAAEKTYFIGVDGLRNFVSGTYAGLPNPNYGRLTMLFAHYTPGTEHFHSIGAWSYSGPPANPSVNSTNTNNRLPEMYQRATGQDYLHMRWGSGVFAGKRISGLDGGEYSNTRMRPVSHLSGSTDEAEQRLFNSSGGRWQGSLGSAIVGLQLLDITPGLNVATESGANILTSVGTVVPISGAGDWSFMPVFWVGANASHGVYSATFRFIDINNTAGYTPLRDSGTFSIDFFVPEPGSLLILGSGIAGLLSRRRRRI